MPVTLRGVNNSFPEYIALPALSLILPGYPTPNTYLAQTSVSQTGAEQIFWDDPYAMAQAASFPALLLSEEDQSSTRANNTMWDDEVLVEVKYFDRWDKNPASIATIWKTIITPDLYRMQSNVQANETLQVGNVNYAIAIPKISLSQELAGNPQGAIDDTTVPGLSLVHRSMFLHINVMPYDSFS